MPASMSASGCEPVESFVVEHPTRTAALEQPAPTRAQAANRYRTWDCTIALLIDRPQRRLAERPLPVAVCTEPHSPRRQHHRDKRTIRDLRAEYRRTRSPTQTCL